MARNMHSCQSEKEGSSVGSWLAGLVVGGLAGVAVALLTAPKPGKEMRGQLRDTAATMPDKLNELVDDSLDLYASGLNYMQLIVEEQTMRIKRAVAAGKLAAAKEREERETASPAILPFQHR